MRIVSSDYTSILGSMDSIIENAKAQISKAESSAKSETTTQTESSDKKARETYGLDTLARMSDEEYAAFERATANLSEKDKMQAAQSLHLVSTSYQAAQKLLLGGGLLDAMNGVESSFTNNPEMLNKGIDVLSSMTNGEGKAMAGFLGRYRGALTSSSLNLSV